MKIFKRVITEYSVEFGPGLHEIHLEKCDELEQFILEEAHEIIAPFNLTLDDLFGNEPYLTAWLKVDGHRECSFTVTLVIDDKAYEIKLNEYLKQYAPKLFDKRGNEFEWAETSGYADALDYQVVI